MARLLVCPLSRVEAVAASSGAASLVTLLTPPAQAPRPASIAPENHLILGLSDICAAQDGHVLAGQAHVDSLLAFVRRWDRAAPLLLHCYAGVSRSTAAAFITLCALTGGDEGAIAGKIRKLSPSATPNRHLVGLADAALRRDGRMIAAIEAIGRGKDCFEGEVFGLDLADLEATA
jgi:predicted protein tyrosine phosphatase